jgi:hypothetical protein
MPGTADEIKFFVEVYNGVTNTLSHVLVTCRRGLDWWIDLLDTHKL